MSGLWPILLIVGAVFLLFFVALVIAPIMHKNRVVGYAQSKGYQLLDQVAFEPGAITARTMMYGFNADDMRYEVCTIRSIGGKLDPNTMKVVMKSNAEWRTDCKVMEHITDDIIMLTPMGLAGMDPLNNPLIGGLIKPKLMLNASYALAWHLPKIETFDIEHVGKLGDADFGIYATNPAARELITDSIEQALIEWNNKAIRTYQHRPTIMIGPEGILLTLPYKATKPDTIDKALQTMRVLQSSLT